MSRRSVRQLPDVPPAWIIDQLPPRQPFREERLPAPSPDPSPDAYEREQQEDTYGISLT